MLTIIMMGIRNFTMANYGIVIIPDIIQIMFKSLKAVKESGNDLVDWIVTTDYRHIPKTEFSIIANKGAEFIGIFIVNGIEQSYTQSVLINFPLI